MIPPDVLRAIRARDAEAHANGRRPTVAQLDRRDLLTELDHLTRRQDPK